MGLLISRNAVLLVAILGFISAAWWKAEQALKRHDARVSREAVANTITNIETANADASSAGTQAARKSRGEIVEVPSIWPRAVWSAPAGNASGRLRSKPVAGAVVDPTAHDD